MVARLTRLLLLLQIGVALAIAAAGTMVLKLALLPALSLGFATILLLRLLIIANNFALSFRYRSETPRSLRLNWYQAARLFLLEFAASLWSSSWSMPFLSFCKRPATQPVGLPVLLIHGYGCNSGYWHSMSKALARANITHHAINLEPVFCEIDQYVGKVRQAIEELCADSGKDKIVIVAHSMGGLVARAYLRACGTARVARVITLGTPHSGTGLANFARGANCKQMSWDGRQASNWLRGLARTEDAALRSLFVSIYSHHDNIIAPQISSCLQGARNVEFHGIGHVTLALHPAVQERVIQEVLAATEPALPTVRCA